MSTPVPTPTPTPTPTPEPFQTLEMACATYTLGDRTTWDSGDTTNATNIKNNCKVVVTFWFPLVEQTSCPFIMDTPGATQYCGPYDNWGYMDATDNEGAYNLGGDMYNYGGVFASCDSNDCGMILRQNSTASPVYNIWSGGGNEHLTDKGNSAFVDLYVDMFEDVPDSPARLARWEGTYITRDWNLIYLDNFHVWIPGEGWNTTPINPRTGSAYTRDQMETDYLAAIQQIEARAALINAVTFANIWSDVESHYFDDTIYPALMNEVDYAWFETWTNQPSGTAESETVWLRRVNAAQDMIKNRKANPVVDCEFGSNSYYNIATLLLVREAGKGMCYFQSEIPSGAFFTKMTTLDCGQPLEDYHLVGNTHYERDWENCKVLVNPKTSATGTIPLGRNYTDLETGGTVTSVTLPAKSGKILIEQ